MSGLAKISESLWIDLGAVVAVAFCDDQIPDDRRLARIHLRGGTEIVAEGFDGQVVLDQLGLSGGDTAPPSFNSQTAGCDASAKATNG